MLRIDLRALAGKPVSTVVDVPADASLLEEAEVTLDTPLRVRGRLAESGPGRFYWQGTLECRVRGNCRRCLASVSTEIAAEVGALFAEDAGDDASMYPIPTSTDDMDLGPMVREELLLAVPPYLLCGEGCRGLCVRCGRDLNEGPCGCEPDPDPRWAALRALQDPGSNDER
jgi:uncharacterized protein